MRVRIRIPEINGDSLGAALASLQTLNELWLWNQAETVGALPPSIYESGVVYRPERGTEEWLTIPDVLAAGWGDCEDLAAWLAADLRVTGEDPDARAIAYQSGPRTWHAVVLRGDGTVDDPSLALGMGWHRGVITPGSPLRRW